MKQKYITKMYQLFHATVFFFIKNYRFVKKTNEEFCCYKLFLIKRDIEG